MSLLSRFLGKIFRRVTASGRRMASAESFSPAGPGSPAPSLPPPPPPPPPPPAAPPPPQVVPPTRGAFGTGPHGDEEEAARVTIIFEDGTVARPELDDDLEERLRYIVDNFVPPSGPGR